MAVPSILGGEEEAGRAPVGLGDDPDRLSPDRPVAADGRRAGRSGRSDAPPRPHHGEGVAMSRSDGPAVGFSGEGGRPGGGAPPAGPVTPAVRLRWVERTVKGRAVRDAGRFTVVWEVD